VTTRSLSYTCPEEPAETIPGVSGRDGAPSLPSEAEILGRAGQENFKVASRLLPQAARQHLMAFYGFARLVDQIGDAHQGDRMEALAWIEQETSRALVDPNLPELLPLVARAAGSVTSLGLDPSPLYALIAANRQDQTVTAYQTFDDLLGYCELSANPVGELVLGAFGVATPDRIRYSNAICTGLQLVEHWQDVTEDANAGRVYLPAEDLRRFGVGRSDLLAPPPAGPALRGLMIFECARARRLLGEGAPLLARLRGRSRWAVAGFWAGGLAALDAITAQGFDPLGAPLRPSRRRTATQMLAGLSSFRATREAA
jgi:squalene synthase HpnC